MESISTHIIFNKISSISNIINVVKISALYINTITLCAIFFLTLISRLPHIRYHTNHPSESEQRSYRNKTHFLTTAIKDKYKKDLIRNIKYDYSHHPTHKISYSILHKDDENKNTA